MMKTRSYPWFTLTLATLLCGCGKGEYENLMQTRMKQLKFGTEFLENLYPAPTTILDGVASLQLPLLIDEDASNFSAGATDSRGDPISKVRLQPPFMDLPGYRFCYEQGVGSGRGRLPFYCYFAVVKADEKNETALLGELRQAASKQFKGVSWQSVELDTPTGDKIAWKKLTTKGPQVFQLSDSADDAQTLPGQFDLYVHSTPAFHFVIGFRAPDQVAASTGLFRKAELALGTLEVAQSAS